MSIAEPGHDVVDVAEAARQLQQATHDARVAYDCIGLGELDRAHTSAVTARVAIDAAVTAVQTALAQATVSGAPYGGELKADR